MKLLCTLSYWIGAVLLGLFAIPAITAVLIGGFVGRLVKRCKRRDCRGKTD